MANQFAASTALLLMLACGARSPANQPQGASSSKNGFDADAALAREASGLTEHAFKGPPLSFKTPASAAPTVKEEGQVILVDIPIGEGGTINCFLYAEDPDPGATLLALISKLKESAQIHELQPGPIEVLHEAPVVPLSAIYTVEQDGQNAIGQMKLAFHTRLNHAALCLNDQAGFSKTFHDVSAAFFGTLDAGREDLKWTYVEVNAATIQGVPAGFERSMITVTDQGERRVSAGLLLFLRSPTDLVTSDSVSSQSLNADGRVAEGRWYDSEGGKAELDLALTLGKGGAYHYEGTFKGKPLAGDFTHSDKRGLSGSKSLERELKQRARKAGAFSITHSSYQPSQDPTRATEDIYSRLAEDPPNRVRIKHGDMQMVGTLDADGRMENGELTLGRIQLQFKRLFVRGKP